LQLIQYFSKRIPAWMILNPSEAGNHNYGPYVTNEGIIHDNDNPKELLPSLYNFKKRQIKKCKDWSISGTDPVEYNYDPSAGLVLDDIAEDPRLFNDPIFGWLYKNSRNFKSWVVFLVQYLVNLPKQYRKQLS